MGAAENPTRKRSTFNLLLNKTPGCRAGPPSRRRGAEWSEAEAKTGGKKHRRYIKETRSDGGKEVNGEGFARNLAMLCNLARIEDTANETSKDHGVNRSGNPDE